MKIQFNRKICRVLAALVAALFAIICPVRADGQSAIAYLANQHGPEKAQFVGKGSSKEDVRLAAIEPVSIVAYPSDQVGPGFGPFVRTGSSRAEVLLILGPPDVKLAANLWVYWDRKTSDAYTNSLGFDTMLILFSRDCVAEQKLVARRHVEKLIEVKRAHSRLTASPSS
jgi:hypothetical protein